LEDHEFSILDTGQTRQKVRDAISTNKLCMVVCAYDLSYAKGIGRRILVQGQPQKKMEDPT
jgi:hypothetical protein